MKKKYKFMIILGILLVITGLGLIMQSKTDKQTKKKDTEQSQKQDTSNKKDKKDKTDNISKDKWPYGNERYLEHDEPMRVREFHNNKEYYDVVVEQFTPYAGKDIAFFTDEMFPIELNDPNTKDGSVKVTSYDADTFKELMKNTRVCSIYAKGDYVDFHFETLEQEAIYYFYDESVSEETSEYINQYYMVNIAPHWWWVEYGPGD